MSKATIRVFRPIPKASYHTLGRIMSKADVHYPDLHPNCWLERRALSSKWRLMASTTILSKILSTTEKREMYL